MGSRPSRLPFGWSLSEEGVGLLILRIVVERCALCWFPVEHPIINIVGDRLGLCRETVAVELGCSFLLVARE